MSLGPLLCSPRHSRFAACSIGITDVQEVCAGRRQVKGLENSGHRLRCGMNTRRMAAAKM